MSINKFDIFSLQETHASDIIIPFLNMHLQANKLFGLIIAALSHFLFHI
jgi:hypothetical protein